MFRLSGKILQLFQTLLVSSCILSGGLSLLSAVPKDSFLGPLIFTAYIHPRVVTVHRHCAKYHLYADNTQSNISWILIMSNIPLLLAGY